MKILYIIPNLNVGGVSKIVHELAEGFLQRQYEIVIIALNKHEKDLIIPSNIKIIELNIKSQSDLFKGVVELLNIVKFEKPDIIHSHTVYSHLFARVISLFFKRCKYIASEHGTMNKSLSNNIAFKLMSYTNFLSDIITNVSQASVNSYIKFGVVGKNKIIRVYNGIDLEKFNNLRKVTRIKKILYVGRISKEKNLHLLIDFMKALPDDIYHCDIVGDGDDLDRIMKYASSQQVTHKVTFLGKRLDVPELMKNYDILLLTSFTEGLPTVVIEAIACRLLVLSTDCGGVKEILEGFEFLVAKNNDVQDLLKKFLSLDQMDLNVIIEKLYQKVSCNFSKQHMITAWESIYKDILGN